jgi:alkylhydroperoxidase family enzyme
MPRRYDAAHGGTQGSRGAAHSDPGERPAAPQRPAIDLVSGRSIRNEGVPDSIWDSAAKHYDERQLAALVLWIATTNFFNRINPTTRQPAPQDWG